MYSPVDTNNWNRIKRELFNQRVRDSISRSAMQAEYRSKAGKHDWLSHALDFAFAGVVLAGAGLMVI